MKQIRSILRHFLLSSTSLASLIKTIIITILSLGCGVGVVRFFKTTDTEWYVWVFIIAVVTAIFWIGFYTYLEDLILIKSSNRNMLQPPHQFVELSRRIFFENNQAIDVKFSKQSEHTFSDLIPASEFLCEIDTILSTSRQSNTKPSLFFTKGNAVESILYDQLWLEKDGKSLNFSEIPRFDTAIRILKGELITGKMVNTNGDTVSEKRIVVITIDYILNEIAQQYLADQTTLSNFISELCSTTKE